MLYQDFRRANALLNQHISQITADEVSFRIHYWGFMPSHYNNSLHRHSFSKSVMYLKATENTQTTESIIHCRKVPYSVQDPVYGIKSAVSRALHCFLLLLKSMNHVLPKLIPGTFEA